MRRFLKYVMLAILLSFVTAHVVSAARVHEKLSPKCVPGRRHVLVANAYATVYLGDEEIEACAYGSRRSYGLGDLPYGDAISGGGVFSETLAGTTVAYEESEESGGNEGPDREKNVVVVRDLRTGKVFHRLPTGVPLKPLGIGEAGIGRTTALVIKSDGAVAWIVSTAEELGGYQVHAVDRLGSRVLAAGGNIDPSSLALAGSRLYWTQGGVPASTVLN